MQKNVLKLQAVSDKMVKAQGNIYVAFCNQSINQSINQNIFI